jgi:hypothetical protein
MMPADFLEKWGPKVGKERGGMAGDLGSVIHQNGDAMRKTVKRLAADADQFRWLLEEAIEHLERGMPPKGCVTDKFIKKVKRALR